MSPTLLGAALLLVASVPGPDADWNAAYKRGDYVTAAKLLQRAVFEAPKGPHSADAAALKQLGLLYAEGKGVERDVLLGCGLLRAHVVATRSNARASASATRDAQALVDRHCGRLSPADRVAAFAAASCPHVGLHHGATVTLEPGWSITFNDRSATVARHGEAREQPLASDLLCRSQVLLLRHTVVDGSTDRASGPRHVIELVTLQSGQRQGGATREIVWQLYEVRGLDVDLAAVQRWEEPGSAWPAPALPEPLARGVSFRVKDSGDIEYEIVDSPPRRGRIDTRSRH